MPRKRRDSGRATVFDVAQAAGVSAITVSRVLRTPDRVAAKTRAKVESAVARLGYRPDPAAKALATDRSDIIGVIVPSLTNTVFSDTLRGINDVADASPFQIQIANSRYSPRAEERLVQTFLTQRGGGDDRHRDRPIRSGGPRAARGALPAGADHRNRACSV